MESSFCGNDQGPFKNYHFSTKMLMQTGKDFCRALMIQLPIMVPKNITMSFMKNIQMQYEHFKILAESGYRDYEDETDMMKYYFDKLERVKNNGKEIQTKHLKKGLAAVLLNMGDIFSDGSSDSSLGSDGGVASEDNLDIEEIEKVLPVNEDADMQQKLATRK